MDIGVVQHVNHNSDTFNVYFKGEGIEILVSHDRSVVVNWMMNEIREIINLGLRGRCRRIYVSLLNRQNQVAIPFDLPGTGDGEAEMDDDDDQLWIPPPALCRVPPISSTCIFTATVSEPWINEIETIHQQGRRIVGLDVEWCPSYSTQRNPVAIIQLCVGRHFLIFQLLYCIRNPYKLFTFLSDPSYTFVGPGIRGDVENLSYDFSLKVTNSVDLCTLAACVSNDQALRNVSLKYLAEIYLGAEIEKPAWVTMSWWDQVWLTESQIKYACADAFVCFELGRILFASVHSA